MLMNETQTRLADCPDVSAFKLSISAGPTGDLLHFLGNEISGVFSVKLTCL